MVLLWSWSASFFLMKFVMAGRIFFVKKIFGHCLSFSHFRIEKTINYLYLKIRKFESKAKNALAANTLDF